MLLPPMVYVSRPDELVQHFRSVAEAVPLPIMLYNNPPAYRTVIDADVLQALADVENIVAVKEAETDTPRFPDFRNAFGDRFPPVAGLDQVAPNGMMPGGQGWGPG